MLAETKGIAVENGHQRPRILQWKMDIRDQGYCSGKWTSETKDIAVENGHH